MEHLFESLGDLVQCITYAGLTVFALYLMSPPEDEDEEDQ